MGYCQKNERAPLIFAKSRTHTREKIILRFAPPRLRRLIFSRVRVVIMLSVRTRWAALHLPLLTQRELVIRERKFFNLISVSSLVDTRSNHKAPKSHIFYLNQI